jgi:hypothetical protein
LPAIEGAESFVPDNIALIPAYLGLPFSLTIQGEDAKSPARTLTASWKAMIKQLNAFLGRSVPWRAILDPKFRYNILKVGNNGKIIERNVGQGNKDRALDLLWTRGGLL